MIDILIADDHKIVLEGLVSLIEKENEINIVGRAENGNQVLKLLENHTIDLAVLDIEMPEKDGVELTKIIRKDYPKIKIVILTMYNEIGFIRRIVEAGAHGYVLKNKGKEELVHAIKTVHNGEEYFGKEVTKTLIKSMKSDTVEGEIKLTNREREVLKLIAQGKTTPQIASELFLAKTTIETHRRNLITKTGLSNSKELVAFAYKNGYN